MTVGFIGTAFAILESFVTIRPAPEGMVVTKSVIDREVTLASYFEAQPAGYSSLPASEALPLKVDPATKSQPDTLCGDGRLQVLVDGRFCPG
jgi:hypothetical protein